MHYEVFVLLFLRRGDGLLLLRFHHGGASETGLQVFHLQRTGGARPELQSVDVCGYGELLFFHSSASGVLDADAEDGEVGEFHAASFEEQLLDTRHHVGDDPLYGTCRIWGVVSRHVFSELVDVNGALFHREGIPFAEGVTAFHIVLFQDVLDHNCFTLKG